MCGIVRRVRIVCIVFLSITARTSLLLRHSASCWSQLRTAARVHDETVDEINMFSLRVHNITSKSIGIIHYWCRRQNSADALPLPGGSEIRCHADRLRMFEVLELVCLESDAYSVERLNYSHYFVPGGKQRNENRVWWCHRCNSHQHSTAENSQSAFFGPVSH